jgi:aminoglycoside 3-N-acetyltransferase
LDLTKDTLIHSSLSNIGKIEGGGVKLTNMLLDKFNLKETTLLAPALPFLGPSAEYLDNIKLFDLTTAKNAMGNIPNQIMKKEGCLRSFHPTHSVIALGGNSQNYIENHENSKTPFCSNSPYYKLTKNDGKILMFGVELNSITNFHVYEDILSEHLPFDVYSKKTYQVKAVNGKTNMSIETKVHDIRMSAKRDCESARKHLISNGYITTYKIGDSEISLLDAKGLTVTLLQMLLNGESIYGKIKITTQQKKIINEKLFELA